MPYLNGEVTIPLKQPFNYWRSLHLPLINCEIELDLLWAKYYVLIEHHNNIKGVDFMITGNKIFISAVTFENLKQGFKRKISWKYFRSQIMTQPKDNNFDYLIHPTLKRINGLFV